MSYAPYWQSGKADSQADDHHDGCRTALCQPPFGVGLAELEVEVGCRVRDAAAAGPIPNSQAEVACVILRRKSHIRRIFPTSHLLAAAFFVSQVPQPHCTALEAAHAEDSRSLQTPTMQSESKQRLKSLFTFNRIVLPILTPRFEFLVIFGVHPYQFCPSFSSQPCSSLPLASHAGLWD